MTEVFDSVVFFSSIPWDYSYHRQQELMHLLARNDRRVLFVEPPSTSARMAWHLRGTRYVEQNILAVSSPGLRFERCLPTVEMINGKISRSNVVRVMASLGISKPIVWFDRIHGTDASWFLDRYPTVYDLVDEITAFGRWRNSRMLKRLERQVVQRVDLCVTSSATLGERKQRYGPRRAIHFCPNGVDCARFSASRDALSGEGSEALCELRRRSEGDSRPIIGFIGTVSSRSIDTELVVRAAVALPQFRFVFVGPRAFDSAATSLERVPNIEVLGAVPPEEVHAVIGEFAVGMIPYRTAPKNMDYVFPRKAFEYLASGIPVVSTDMIELRSVERGIRLARDLEGFCLAISEAVKDAEVEEDSVELRRVAREYDWRLLLARLEHELERIAGDAYGRSSV